jgi:Flp pilus assembly protein TadG
VLVELALISTILVTLVLGVFEIGMAWSDHQEVTAASRSGARVGSQLGTSAQADNQILLSVQAGLGSLAPQVAKIVIFEADANGNMPAACETAGAGYAGAAHCNVYGTTSLAALSTPNQWGSGAACGPLDGNWCSVTKRSNIQATATYLGVYVEINHKYLTGLFGGGTKKMTESTVMRLEPVQ